MKGPRNGTVYVVQFSLGIAKSGGDEEFPTLNMAKGFAIDMRERGFTCRVIEYTTTHKILDDDMTAARLVEAAESE